MCVCLHVHKTFTLKKGLTAGTSGSTREFWKGAGEREILLLVTLLLYIFEPCEETTIISIISRLQGQF